MTTSFHGVKY